MLLCEFRLNYPLDLTGRSRRFVRGQDAQAVLTCTSYRSVVSIRSRFHPSPPANTPVTPGPADSRLFPRNGGRRWLWSLFVALCPGG